MTSASTQNQQGEAQLRVNPRSTGIVSPTTYEKQSQQQSLLPEAEELRRCEELDLRTEHISPVKFLEYNEKENKLVTERVVGNELFHTIWNPTYLLGRLKGHRLRDKAILLSRILELGTWLRQYHESSKRKPNEDKLDLTWLEFAFHQKVNDLREDKLISERKLSRIESVFGSEIVKMKNQVRMEETGIFSCLLHGDFTIYNILVDSENNFRILDFGDTRVSTNLEDVARFYSSLWAISKTNKTRKRLLNGIPERFLASYGLSPRIVETPYFRCNLAFNYMTHLSGQNYMKHLLSWNSNLEMSQISRAGMRWIYQQL